jgi:hypothetical protein
LTFHQYIEGRKCLFILFFSTHTPCLTLLYFVSHQFIVIRFLFLHIINDTWNGNVNRDSVFVFLCEGFNHSTIIDFSCGSWWWTWFFSLYASHYYQLTISMIVQVLLLIFFYYYLSQVHQLSPSYSAFRCHDRYLKCHFSRYSNKWIGIFYVNCAKMNVLENFLLSLHKQYALHRKRKLEWKEVFSFNNLLSVLQLLRLF